MKKSFLLMLLAGVALSSCHDSDEPAPLPRIEPQADWTFPNSTITDPSSLEIPHYVTGYIWTEKFYAGCGGYRLPDNRIVIGPEVGFYAGYDSESASAREAYETLCRWNNDMTCNRKEVNFDKDSYQIYLAVEVVGIDLVSNRAWGDRAAGTSWADLCWLEGLSPYEYIQSGYTKYFDWTTEGLLFAGVGYYWQPGLHDCKRILKPLAECTPDDLRMLICKGHSFIHLSQKPVDVMDHRFTVIFTLADGQVIHTPVTMWD